MRNIYNIYCDESSVDNPGAKFMVIGALFVARSKVPQIKNKIKELQNKHHIKGELKWIKASNKSLDFYKELFTYLFSLRAMDLSYRCIVVDKELVDYKTYHNEDKELAFYKFYYQLLKKPLERNNNYYIFLDFRPSRDANRVRRLGEFLRMVCGDIIKHIQGYSSDNNIFIQIADVITGAIAFSRNKLATSRNKKQLASVIAKSIDRENLSFSSLLSEKRFNIFFIILGENK